MRNKISSTPVLRCFDAAKEVVLQCDASSTGLGGALLRDAAKEVVLQCNTPSTGLGGTLLQESWNIRC